MSEFPEKIYLERKDIKLYPTKGDNTFFTEEYIHRDVFNKKLKAMAGELMKIIEKGIPNRIVFENQVKDIYLRYVYQEI